ncbi:hypothetical protein BJ912DRAFT_189747 [Pholiota molesta]|nr:hypothetical protein BJ912DRAFT_189747 [Pholiota molesta]
MNTNSPMNHAKKLSAGMAATVTRLETFPTVQNTLKSIGEGGAQGELAFLAGSAATAISILQTIQNIEDKDIDGEFVNLALDACGLVYIVTHQCSENIGRSTTISRDMRMDAKELERHLKQAHIFVQKKAGGSLARRINPRKIREDKGKITEYREQFRRWMLKFGAGSQGSIHHCLQEIIDRKVNEGEQHAIATRKAKENTTVESSLSRITADMGNIHTNDSDNSHVNSFTPPKQATMPMPTIFHDPNNSHVNSFTPPKQATMPEPTIIHSTPPVITISDTHRDARPIDIGLPIPMPEAPSGIRDDVDKTHRTDAWHAMRIAEKERWRKSEQEFANLPPATPDDEEPPSHLRQNQQIPEQRRSETPIARPFTPRDLGDAAMTRALQERFPERSADELQAMLLAARSQLQREEEERRESLNRPKSKKVNKTNWPDSDEEISPRPGARPFSGRSHPEAKNPGSYSESENRLRSDQGSGRSTSPPYNSSQGHPPGLSPPHGSMRFEDIKYSGISFGGGPVNVRNVNTGNITTTTYNDSMNDKSVRNYYH